MSNEMKEKMDELGNAILKKTDEWASWKLNIGNDGTAKKMLCERWGMEKAFDIVFGRTFTDWLIEQEN